MCERHRLTRRRKSDGLIAIDVIALSVASGRCALNNNIIVVQINVQRYSRLRQYRIDFAQSSDIAMADRPCSVYIEYKSQRFCVSTVLMRSQPQYTLLKVYELVGRSFSEFIDDNAVP